ncbi:MAG: ABC transporter ATP-binding protein [Proteobacteria bacterium]|nr:MAG: ABC transporter ATP-binding protein [Pseudomonadota bacterium]
MAQLLEVNSVATRFGSLEVHKDVSFSIKESSVVAVIGGSGTGKSVLLREILGLLRPDSGTIRLFGQDIWSAGSSELERIRNRVGVLFQNGALFSGLSVAKNVAVPLKEHTGLSDEVIEKIVEMKIAISGLAPEAGGKMPSELSGGMRKRAALARALALDPQLLFLDEPTSGLDPITARAFDHLIRVLCDGLGLTVIIITHDLDTLFSVVDRVIVLKEGRVLADGPVREVARTQDPWIKEYFESRLS